MIEEQKESQNRLKREEMRRRRQQERTRQVRRIRILLACSGCLLLMILVNSIFRGHNEVPAYVGNESSSFPEGDGSQDYATEAEGAAGLSDITEDEAAPDDRASYLSALEKLESEEPRISEVLAREAEYPDRLLKMLALNLETLDFVLDYPEKKELPCEKTIGRNGNKGEIPLLLQWDERWGYGPYGASIVGASGCGPTCIAMVADGLTGRSDITPYTVAAYSEEQGFLTDQMDTSWDLMTWGCEIFGIRGTMLGLDRDAMVNTLNAGYPIICSMGPGDFTTSGHFIVLTGFRGGEFQVNDPNSRVRSERGWSYEELKDQIVNMWYYALTEAI